MTRPTAPNGSRAENRSQRATDYEIAELERAAWLEEIYIQSAGTLLASAKLETQFVITGALPEQAIGFLVGRPEAGKSFLAYDAALAVARGRPWLGFDVPEPGRVLVLNYDNPHTELGRRFLKLGMTKDDPIWFHSIAAAQPPEGLPALLRIPDSLYALMAVISRIRPSLVILDALRQAHTLEERSSQDMAMVMACLRQMTQYGASVLALHHLRKKQQGKEEDDAEAMRGSTEIEASADSIMLVRQGRVELMKSRGWKPEITECDFSVTDEGDRTFVRSGQTFEALEAVMQAGPLTEMELARALGLSRESVDRLLRRALAAGIVVDGLRTPKGSRGWGWKGTGDATR